MFFYNAFKVMDWRLQSRGWGGVLEGSTWTDNDMELSERSWLLEDYEGRGKSVPESERIVILTYKVKCYQDDLANRNWG
ncbi:unnamed protein product [Callosobruchus maculatus]|uniref:Uncharacterized protein n=1 Tax=Callosobruchus maculatus TaxID=64391 RepID=A0A653DEM0_CALMS|nr:unnamed protein product [Callosobruchus maculatus]